MDKNYSKKRGIFPTPEKIVEYICRDIDFREYKKILEPGFGTGNFLDNIIKNKSKDTKAYAVEIENNFYKKALKKYKKQNAIIQRLNYITNFNVNNFDLIIGNPPYGLTLSEKEIEHIMINDQIFLEKSKESAIIFLYKAIYQLKKSGRIIFILPSTILRVHSYKGLRDYLKEEMTINRIINLGQSFPDVGYETIVLDMTKEKPTKNYEIQIDDFVSGNNHTISYDYLKNREIIPIYINQEIEKIISKMESNTIQLDKICEMPRGININASDKRLMKEMMPDHTRMLVGRNIGKFHTNEEPTYYVPNILLKNLKKRFGSNKILVQNLAYKIVATLNTDQDITNDTVNNLEIKINDFLPEYLLAILNSRIMIFYLQNAITNKARLNIHMDKYYLGKIPIKKIPISEQKTIKKMVNIIIDRPNVGIREKIEEKIMEIYKINKNFDINKYSIMGKKNV
jgi:adenine-specific DNA-methyltransferase